MALSGDGGDETFGGYPRYELALNMMSMLSAYLRDGARSGALGLKLRNPRRFLGAFKGVAVGAATDVSLICAGTPSCESGELNLEFIKRVYEEIGAGEKNRLSRGGHSQHGAAGHAAERGAAHPGVHFRADAG